MIVLLDDDPGMRSSLHFLLQAHGYGVTDYADPACLFGDLARTSPACAIIDIHLADTDGLVVGRSLHEIRPDLPVIFITGRADQRIRDGATNLGAVTLLEKPFTDAALLEAVQRGIARERQVEPPSIH